MITPKIDFVKTATKLSEFNENTQLIGIKGNGKIKLFSKNFFSKLYAWLSGYSFNKNKVTSYLTKYQKSGAYSNMFDSYVPSNKQLSVITENLILKLTPKDITTHDNFLSQSPILPGLSNTTKTPDKTENYDNIATDANLQFQVIKLLRHAYIDKKDCILSDSIFDIALGNATSEERQLLNAYKEHCVPKKNQDQTKRANFLKFLETGEIINKGRNSIPGLTTSEKLTDRLESATNRQKFGLLV